MRWLTLVLACLLGVSSALAQPSVISNKPLVVDAYGNVTPSKINGTPIIIPSGTSLGGGTASVRGIAREIWLSTRTDGKAGVGTAEDPYDASTQAKFDAIMLGYYNAGTTDLTFHFAPGTYTTRGSLVWHPNARWNFRGAGMRLTTLLLDPTMGSLLTPGGGYQIIGSAYNVDSDGSEVTDMTLDANAQNMTGIPTLSGYKNIALSGVHFYGSKTAVRRCLFKNSTGNNASAECFDVLLEGYYDGGLAAAQIPINNTVEDCTFETPRGNYHSSAVIAGFGGGTITQGSLVRHNTFKGYKGTGGGGELFSCGGITSGQWTENTAIDCNIMFRTEGPNKNLSVTWNTLSNCNDRGISFEAANGSDNTEIAHNVIEMMDNGPVRAWGIYVAPYTNNKNFNIHDNTILVKSAGGGVPGGVRGLQVMGSSVTGQGVMVTNNTFATAVVDNVVPTDASIFNNHTTTGGAAPSLANNQIILPTQADQTVLGNVSGGSAVPIPLNGASLRSLVNLTGVVNTFTAANTFNMGITPAANPFVVTNSAGGNAIAADVTGAGGGGVKVGFLSAAPSARLSNPDLGTLATTFGLANGTPTFGAGNLTGLVAVAKGGTGTASPALIAGTGITITGAWPNQTITGSAGGAGSGDALVANPLSQFSATSSAQLAGVISDERGYSNGAKVLFSNGPIIDDAAGTPQKSADFSIRSLYDDNGRRTASWNGSVFEVYGTTTGSSATIILSLEAVNQAAATDNAIRLSDFNGDPTFKVDGEGNLQLSNNNSTGLFFDVNSATGVSQSPGLYYNFSLTAGATGYGFRDLGGVMQFKNSGGAWTAVGSGGGGSAPSDAAFDSSWNGVTTIAPSKNAVYNIIHAFDTDNNGKVNVLDVVGPGIPKVTSGGVVSLATAGTDYLTPGAIGTTVQAYSTNLDTWAGVTPAAGVGAFLATPSSANLRTALTDKNGTGTAIFNLATNPVFLAPNTASASAWDVTLRGNTKTLTGPVALTFSGTPVAGQIFGGTITGDGTARVVTMPANCKSLTRNGGALASFTVPVNGIVELSIRWDGTNYIVAGDPPQPLSVYANNAAALAGSLTVGDYYRTGGDPDLVCVVH